MISLSAVSFVPLGIAVIGGIFWLARLEGKANTAVTSNDKLDKRFDTLEKKFDDLKNILLNAYINDGGVPRT